MLVNQSRFVAEKALAIAEEDSYLARKLAVEVLPKDLKRPDRPYTAEAEMALRKACKYGSAVLHGHTGYVYSAAYSPDGREIVSASWSSFPSGLPSFSDTSNCFFIMKSVSSPMSSAWHSGL